MERRAPPDWLRLPLALQHQFFDHAAVEAAASKARLLARAAKVEQLRPFVRSSPLPTDRAWEDWRVAVVDGSNSPGLSERLGGRFAAYTAGFLIFAGTQQVEEGYSSGQLAQEQLGAPEVTAKVLALLRLWRERQAALHCLRERRVDWVVVDGSFFGFRAEADLVREVRLGVEGFATGRELVRGVAELSWELLKSRRVVGVIKRSRTSALDGWLLWRLGEEERCVGANDKEILTVLLPVGHWFAYRSLFTHPWEFHYFTRLREMWRYEGTRGARPRDAATLLRNARQSFERGVYRTLGISSELVRQAARYFVRCCAMPPFEVEVHPEVDVMPLLAYFAGFHNAATGLPWPLDLVDAQVSLPTGFLREFVEEVEARLLQDPEVRDKGAVARFFSYLNPQKPED